MLRKENLMLSFEGMVLPWFQQEKSEIYNDILSVKSMKFDN